MRVCFFGDSFVNGTGDDDCLGWVGRLCAAERRSGLDLTAYNLGVRRDASVDILCRWRGEAEARMPPGCDGRLVFSFGLNDCAPNDHGGGPRLSRETTLANASAILGEAAGWLPTLMIGPLPVTDDPARNEVVIQLSHALGELCDELDVAFLSVVPAIDALYPLWRAEAEAGDGVHPNRASYAALAEWIHSSEVWRSGLWS
jgi:lysophospholipase L1-like esterase